MGIAMALSLYGFNVSPGMRAEKLYAHFDGDCMELDELEDILVNRPGYEATELPFPTAEVYVMHALERYGDEAERRATIERNACV